MVPGLKGCRYILIHPYRSPWLVVYVCLVFKGSFKAQEILLPTFLFHFRLFPSSKRYIPQPSSSLPPLPLSPRSSISLPFLKNSLSLSSACGARCAVSIGFFYFSKTQSHIHVTLRNVSCSILPLRLLDVSVLFPKRAILYTATHLLPDRETQLLFSSCLSPSVDAPSPTSSLCLELGSLTAITFVRAFCLSSAVPCFSVVSPDEQQSIAELTHRSCAIASFFYTRILYATTGSVSLHINKTYTRHK